MPIKAFKLIKISVQTIMDSVHDKSMNMSEDIGGGWYANQKQLKRNKIENL